MIRKTIELRQATRGFTLIELLVVLMILGLLAGLVGPRIMKYLGGAKTDTAQLQIEEFGTFEAGYDIAVSRLVAIAAVMMFRAQQVWNRHPSLFLASVRIQAYCQSVRRLLHWQATLCRWSRTDTELRYDRHRKC